MTNDNLRIAYFDCFAGISGDMTLGALVDAGADFEALNSELEKLPLRHDHDGHEFELTLEKVTKRGISAADITVHLHEHHHHEHEHEHEHEHHAHSHGRSFSEIKQMIEQSELADRVKQRAIAIFTKLGNAEAKIHDKSIEEIHFHEVGAVDSIVDIVGACICLELLGIDKLYCSPIPTFTGMVDIAHGKFPLPAPATMEILRGVPWRELGIEGEIVTPTGAAIVATLAESFGTMPAMNIVSTGYGSGKKDFGIPNVLRVLTGTPADKPNTDVAEASEHVEVAVIETNIDDVSPQIYEVVMERLFDAGALDVYLSPIQMKKNRPASLLSVICDPASVDKLSEIIFEETTSIGVRIDTRRRICLEREFTKVETEFGQITIKFAKRNGQILNIQPEYEDCKASASKHSVPIKRVRDAAVVAFYSNT